MDRATDHDEMVRIQASRRLLKHLFGGYLEQAAITPYQSVTTVGTDYMGRDAYSEEAN